MQELTFDLETTSLDKETCEIIELAIHLTDENGEVIVSKSKYYKPSIPISPEATAVHGITNEMLADAPLFKDDAPKLKKLFEGKRIKGYNILRFDIPVLLNCFERAGVTIDFPTDIVDVLKLETLLNPNTLSAVYKRYAGKDFENAHSGLADVLATNAVLDYQLSKIDSDGLNKDELMKQVGIPEGSADFYGKLKFDEQNFLVYTFGKWKNTRVVDQPQYAEWILSPSQTFPSQIKTLIREELKKNIRQEFKKAEGKSQGFFKPPVDKELDFTKN